MAEKIFNGKERRAYFRLNKEYPIRFRLCDKEQDKVYNAVTKNISRGGICLEVHEEKEELLEKLSQNEDKLPIDVETPRMTADEEVISKPVWINGSVEWAQTPGDNEAGILMGLAFTDMSDDIRKNLHNFILDKFVKQYGEN